MLIFLWDGRKWKGHIFYLDTEGVVFFLVSITNKRRSNQLLGWCSLENRLGYPTSNLARAFTWLGEFSVESGASTRSNGNWWSHDQLDRITLGQFFVLVSSVLLGFYIISDSCTNRLLCLICKEASTDIKFTKPLWTVQFIQSDSWITRMGYLLGIIWVSAI